MPLNSFQEISRPLEDAEGDQGGAHAKQLKGGMPLEKLGRQSQNRDWKPTATQHIDTLLQQTRMFIDRRREGSVADSESESEEEEGLTIEWEPQQLQANMHIAQPMIIWQPPQMQTPQSAFSLATANTQPHDKAEKVRIGQKSTQMTTKVLKVHKKKPVLPGQLDQKLLQDCIFSIMNFNNLLKLRCSNKELQKLVHTCKAFKKFMPCVPPIDYVAGLWEEGALSMENHGGRLIKIFCRYKKWLRGEWMKREKGKYSEEDERAKTELDGFFSLAPWVHRVDEHSVQAEKWLYDTLYQVLVTVPQGKQPGEFFSVEVPGRGSMRIEVPENVSAGDSMQLMQKATNKGMALKWIKFAPMETADSEMFPCVRIFYNQQNRNEDESIRNYYTVPVGMSRGKRQEHDEPEPPRFKMSMLNFRDGNGKPVVTRKHHHHRKFRTFFAGSRCHGC